ncbi:MAG TPA: AraC family transcriptional regulator [Gemmatimonadaceae bacterium]|nr:AraC family transcriptional regulator [Gemmatimonadaceae bacterium]
MTRSRYWTPRGLAGVELLRWDASTHRYARHSHEGYAIGVVQCGAHAFTARGRKWTAVPGCVIVVNPEDAHDGRPAVRDSAYSYRMMYVERNAMALAGTPFFRECVVTDGALAGRLLEIHRALERPEARLECDTLVTTALRELAEHHGGVRLGTDTSGKRQPEVSVILEYLTEHFAEECSLADLAALAGVNRFQLLRAFRQQVGLPPHRFQTQLRLRRAKRMLTGGQSAASVASAVGFSDQSHLIRKFKAAYGVTPGAITFNPKRRQ